MGVFGDHLRRERQSRNISLDQIAQATKISKRQLQALEDEAFHQLPGGIFNKGYIRAYCKFIGLDEDRLVAEYLEAAGQGAAAAEVEREVTPQPDTHIAMRVNPVLVVALAGVLVVAGVAAGGWHLYRAHRQAAHPNHVVAAVAPAAPVVQAPQAVKTEAPPTRTAEVKPAESRRHEHAEAKPETKIAVASTAVQTPPPTEIASAKPMADAAPIELTVRAKDPAWVSIRSDGKVAMHGLMKPSDVKTVRASNQVVFWTGHAGDVDVSFNGKDVPLTGNPTGERVLVFNTRGLLPRSSP